MNKEFIFMDIDLDGAGSYLAFKWCTGKTLPYKPTRVSDFSRDFTEWLKSNDIEEYKSIYIFDLDVSDYIELVDRPNIVIVDHHATHITNKDKYKHAKVILQDTGSCTKLIYNTFKNPVQPLPVECKLLIVMVNDYDSYKLQIADSYKLNLIYWNYQGNRVFHFLNRFQDGFDGFTSKEKSIIQFYEKKLKHVKNNLDVHVAPRIPIQGSPQKLVSVFADSHINEVADHIIKNYKADIGFVINPISNKVSLRRSDKCTVNLGNLAKKLFDVGGGHEAAAGGDLCEEFVTFSKIFKPMKISIGA